MIGLELLRTMPALPPGARLYAWVISGFGFFLLFSGFATWESRDPIKFLCYFLITLLGSGLRVSLPSAAGSLPVNLLFVLIGVIDLSVSETLALAVFSTLVQVVAHHSLLWQCVFQIAVTAIGVTACQMAYQSEALVNNAGGLPVRLLLTGAALFAANTLPVATVIALAEAKHFQRVWREGFLWTFTYYFAGAAAAGLYVYASRLLSWQLAMLIIPVFYLIYRSYGLYMARIDAERKHAEEMSALHLRTIEALALAIEAKDNTTHDHLQRVQIYALEVGRELELSDLELEALRTASLLHDIGKLAVPEHIISKPGRLTPEEFEKMKIHPVVGAEILERVAFPYPVVPIVRSHHEKWDGSGYPHGLRGEEIPIGARILAAVDCLDALASDRQYRKALPLDEAMGVVRRDAGKAFDPRVVEVLERRYRDLEAQAQEKSAALMKVS
ncbi:MAG: HD-GYP domain-containing protein, partial [Bryobacteraceae bacterium]|nr:HD-GYP domain-containing protein [Bryobacteraceae bacterium]